MEDRDLLARIDSHMERGNQLMNRVMATLDRVIATLDRVDARLDRAAHAQGDLRAFIREATVRFERSARAQERGLERAFSALQRVEAGAQRVEEGLRRTQDGLQRVLERQDDLHAESRAQTQALLRVLDRLGPGPAQA